MKRNTGAERKCQLYFTHVDTAPNTNIVPEIERDRLKDYSAE